MTQPYSQQISAFLEHMFLRSGSDKSIENNKVSYLKDSKENFPAWLEGLSSAKSFICIEIYIFARNDFGQQFRDILLTKLSEGVRVYLIYDWFGSLDSVMFKFFKPLIAAGAKVKAFNKPNVLTGLGILSRDHRKSIIIDGNLAFVSGLCISSDWEGDPKKGIPPWRDSGLKLQGPVVSDILKAFKDTWSLFNEPFTEEVKLQPLTVTKQESVACRVVATSRSNANMFRLDMMAINLARKSIWITDAYFMPTRVYIQQLVDAAKDGVDVRILVPRTSDIPWISSVSRTQYRQLLNAGVRIFEWNGSMIHSKTLVLDGTWARVGSTNLNFSSWFANRELDIILEGENAAFSLKKAFLEDLQNSTEIILSKSNKTKLVKKREKLTAAEHMAISNKQTKALARQVAYLSKSINDVLLGSQDEVDKPEFYAFVSIGGFLLILSILFFYFPKLIAYPIVFFLFFGFVLMAIKAYQSINYLIKNRKESKEEAEEEAEEEAKDEEL